MTGGHLSVLFSPRNSCRNKDGSSRVNPVSLSHLVVKEGKVVQAEKKKLSLSGAFGGVSLWAQLKHSPQAGNVTDAEGHTAKREGGSESFPDSSGVWGARTPGKSHEKKRFAH